MHRDATPPTTIHVEVIQAWPRRHASVTIELPDGATVDDALSACKLLMGQPLAGEPSMTDICGYAIHGERATRGQVLHDGDRLELLRALQADPKEARRRRAKIRR